MSMHSGPGNPNWKTGQSGNPNGRAKGIGNKTNEAIKLAYKKLLEDNLENMSAWLAKVAEKDPARATELVIKLSDFVVPKLARTELAGHDGEDLLKNITFTFNTANHGKKEESTSQTSSSEESETPGSDPQVAEGYGGIPENGHSSPKFTNPDGAHL